MKTTLLLTITVVAWGWSFVATKICLDYMSPEEVVGLRLIIALPVLLVILAARRIKLPFDGRYRWRLLISGAVLALHFLIQVIGMKYTSAINTAWIIGVIPLVLIVFSFVFLGERIGVYGILGVGIATIGILTLISKGQYSNFGWLKSVGDWMILASTHTWAIYTILTRDISRNRDSLAVTVGVFLPAALGLFLYMLFTSDWSKFLSLPAEPIIAMLFLGIVAMALAHWFWQMGVASIGAAKAGVFLYLEPLATTALAVPLLDESFGLFTASGGLLVLLGVYIAEKGKKTL